MKTKEDCSRYSVKLKINAKSLHTFSHINFHIKLRILIAGISLDTLKSCVALHLEIVFLIWLCDETLKPQKCFVVSAVGSCNEKRFICVCGFANALWGRVVFWRFRKENADELSTEAKFIHVVFVGSQQLIQGKSLYDRFTGDLRANKFLDFQLNFLSLIRSLLLTSINSPASPLLLHHYSLILAGFVSVYFFVLF